MDDEMIEMALVQARRHVPALSSGKHARPQTLEPKHAERTAFGCAGERRGKILDEGHGGTTKT